MAERCYWCSRGLSGELSSDGQTHLKCERAIWSSNRTSGCVIAFMLMPIAGIGFVVGCLYSAIRAGFAEGSGLWKQAFDFMRKPKP